MKIEVSVIGFVVLFLIGPAGCCTGPQIAFIEKGDRVDVIAAGRPFTSYLIGDAVTKPILYPLCTASGIVVNRGHPLAEVPGESKDHPHHAGLFFTYDRVNETGFWNNTTSPPRIRHLKVVKSKGGAGEGILATLSHWTGKDDEILLKEKREMIFRASEGVRTIDFRIELEAAEREVVFADTKEGMFAIRVAHWLKEKGGNGEYLSSTGGKKAKNVWGRRAAWVRLEGEKDGTRVGILICDHPESVNHPTYWHARDYGLFAANPLGQAVFEKSRGNKEAKPFRLVLAPGDKALFRFRVVFYEGAREVAELKAWFDDFAAAGN